MDGVANIFPFGVNFLIDREILHILPSFALLLFGKILGGSFQRVLPHCGSETGGFQKFAVLGERALQEDILQTFLFIGNIIQKTAIVVTDISEGILANKGRDGEQNQYHPDDGPDGVFDFSEKIEQTGGTDKTGDARYDPTRGGEDSAEQHHKGENEKSDQEEKDDTAHPCLLLMKNLLRSAGFLASFTPSAFPPLPASLLCRNRSTSRLFGIRILHYFRIFLTHFSVILFKFSLRK